MAIKAVPVHSATLKWAREEIGLSTQEVADKLQQPLETVEAWETGEAGMGLSIARKLANTYKISLPVLYLQNIPEEWRQEKPRAFPLAPPRRT